MKIKKTVRAFTYRGSSVLSKLETDVEVHSDIRADHSEHSLVWKAVWDTGATNTCISHRLVNDLHLISTGKIMTRTANELVETDVYCIDIVLPNKLTIKDVRAQALDLYECDLLIGMDIIRFGDFSVTTNNDKTIFSFRTPSVKHIDFVKELDEQEKALKL